MRALFTFILALAVARLAVAVETNALPAEEVAKIVAYERAVLHRLAYDGLTNATAHLQRSNLLVIRVNRGEELHYSYSVKENGKEMDSRETGYASQDTHWNVLTEDQLKKLRAVLAQLPRESATPPWERTIFVGFKSGTNSLSRIYDYDHQPAALSKIHDIITEGWELRETK